MEKERLQQVIDEFPENVDIDALMDRLYLLKKIEVAEQQFANGQGIPHSEVKERLSKWLK